MNWKDILKRINQPLTPPRRVDKTDEEWEKLLTPEQFQVTRLHGTERAFSGEYCEAYSPGIYHCLCCDTPLFDSTVKFHSQSGWPSFTEPYTDNVVKYLSDNSYGMQRIEVLCNVCDAHLGHVFPDGPPPGRLRFCINSLSLKKQDAKQLATTETATFGGGCFWCTEAIMLELEGVSLVTSGYSGGTVEDPTYRQVSGGSTGHAEVVQVEFDNATISYADLLRVFMATHDPTTLNRQGADVGTQYRSIILFHSDVQQRTAMSIISELQEAFNNPIVTEVVPFIRFYKADPSHQEYYRKNADNIYCQAVITPKLSKMRREFDKLRKRDTKVAS